MTMEYSTIISEQRNFFLSGQTRDIDFRKDALRKLFNILKDNENRLYQAIFEDFGKSEADTYSTELSIIYAEIRFFLKKLGRLSKPIRTSTNLANLPAHFRIIREPLGNILIIGAWNYPYQLTLVPMIDAIAAGNTCILKPSELPERTMKLMAEIINNNFPAGFLYVAEGGVPETTDLLSLRYDKIFFTGSPRVGRIVYQAAAVNMTPVALELGGKSPVVVTAKADLKAAAKRIVWGKFLNAGQTCVAPDYLYVEERVKEEFIGLLKERIIMSGYGNGSDNYVKIINRRHFDRLSGLIDKDKVFFGGECNAESLYISPTIMDNVDWDDKVMQEEIFGPILPVLTFKNLSEVINKIRSMEKPLASYIFTKDRKEKEVFLNEVSSGGACVNDVMMHLVNENAPFGGIGNSGIGNYHGEYGFDTFSHHKTVLRKPARLENNIKYPPYRKWKMDIIKKLI